MKRKGLPRSNYTLIPNVILDNISKLDDCELRVLMSLCRETFGWGKERIKLSITDLQTLTGLSDQGVINGVKRLIKSGTILRTQSGQGFCYSLVVEQAKTADESGDSGEEKVPTGLASGTNRVGGDVPTGLAGFTPAIYKGKEKKESNGDFRRFTDQWSVEFNCAKGRSYVYNGAIDGKAVNKLLKSGLTIDELIGIAKEAWSQPDDGKHWACINQSRTIAKFASSLNEIRDELSDGTQREDKEFNRFGNI